MTRIEMQYMDAVIKIPGLLQKLIKEVKELEALLNKEREDEDE